jgi:hypothetical protein
MLGQGQDARSSPPNICSSQSVSRAGSGDPVLRTQTPSARRCWMTSNWHTQLLAEARIQDLRRAADASRLARAAKDASRPPSVKLEIPITIRPARAADASALANLAERDSAEVPLAPVLIAEASGELRAAVSLYDGAAIADPLKHTLWMVELLQTRAAQLSHHRPVRWRQLFRAITGRREWAT